VESRGAFTLTDSAGVQIKEYRAPENWNAQLSLRELVRVGTVDGPAETLFSTIAGGRILPDGRLVLADMTSLDVRVFAADGTFLGRHGGKGQGPGEYEYIIAVSQCGPSGFTVFDFGWTMNSYEPHGEFIKEEPVRLEQGTTPYYLACDTTGRLAAVNWDMAAEGARTGFYTSHARLRILREGREPLDLGERIGSERIGSAGGSGPHPFGRMTRFGFTGMDLIVSDGSFFGFERWDTAGHLAEIDRVAGVAPPNIDSLTTEYLDWRLSRARDDEARARTRQQVAEMANPARASYWSDLLVTADWILLRELTVGRKGRWFAFERGGTLSGYLPLPADAAVLDQREGKLLVAVRDELDVVRAVLYSIQAAAPSRD